MTSATRRTIASFTALLIACGVIFALAYYTYKEAGHRAAAAAMERYVPTSFDEFVAKRTTQPASSTSDRLDP